MRGNTLLWAACKIPQYTEFGRHEQSPHQTMHGTPCFAQKFQLSHGSIASFSSSVSTNVFKNVMRLFNESTITSYPSLEAIFSGILGNPAYPRHKRLVGQFMMESSARIVKCAVQPSSCVIAIKFIFSFHSTNRWKYWSNSSFARPNNVIPCTSWSL